MVRRIPYLSTPARSARRPIPYQGTMPAEPQRPRYPWVQIAAPPGRLDITTTAALLAALHRLGGTLGLEIAATATSARIGIRATGARASEAARVVRGIAPGWTVDLVDDHARLATRRMAATITRPGAPDWLPLGPCDPAFDPVGLILEAFHPAGDGDGLLVQYALRPAAARRERARRELHAPAAPSSLLGALGGWLSRERAGPGLDARALRLADERLERTGFEVQAHLTLWGEDRTTLASRARSVTAAFSALWPGESGLSVSAWSWLAGPAGADVTWRGNGPSLYLSDQELAMLWHPPSEAVRVPGIVRAPTTSGLLPPELERARGVLLGIFHGRGRDVPVHLPRRDLEAGHAIVIGRTGVGKSTLLHQVNRGFLAAPDQPAVAVIDPHGDLVADLAAQSLPSSREDQTVILDLGDIEFPVGIPLFAGPAGVTQEELIQRTFGVFKLIFREVWSPTRMEDAIFALVATLCAQSRATLLDIAPLLLDPGFRRRAISSVVDSTVREFWSDYEQLSEGGKRELARPILNRTRALYRSSAVRNMLCQERGCDFTDLVDRGGVLLVKLSGAAIQAEADLLGELIIAHLHLALLGRLAQARAQRRAFYLTVDESQRFAGASLPILLREGRKLGVAMMLSTQYLDAWGEELAESVLGNAGMLLAFRSGPADSRRLRASIRPYTTEDLQDLDRYTAIAKLQLDGRTMPAVSLRTLPIEAPPDPAVLARIRSATRVRYARPRREVEADLARPSGPANPRDRMDIDEE